MPAAPAKSEESGPSEEPGRENAIGSKESEESEDLGPMRRAFAGFFRFRRSPPARREHGASIFGFFGFFGTYRVFAPSIFGSFGLFGLRVRPSPGASKIRSMRPQSSDSSDSLECIAFSRAPCSDDLDSSDFGDCRLPAPPKSGPPGGREHTHYDIQCASPRPPWGTGVRGEHIENKNVYATLRGQHTH